MSLTYCFFVDLQLCVSKAVCMESVLEQADVDAMMAGKGKLATEVCQQDKKRNLKTRAQLFSMSIFLALTCFTVYCILLWCLMFYSVV